MTGLPIDTLRAWERRHAAVTPTRDLRGRMYSDADVERLRLLRDAISNGHPIGRIAQLHDAVLRELAAPLAVASSTAASPAREAGAGAERIAAALAAFNLPQVELQLARAATLLTATELLRDVIMPAMREVGDRWHTEPLGIAREHLLSGAVRNLLGSLIRVHSRSDATGRLLFATPSGERHEFGALGGALVAASSGLSVTYLGPDIPAADIVEMATVAACDVVVLAVTLGDPVDHGVMDEVQSVAARLPADIELWLGGPAAPHMPPALTPRVLIVPDYDALTRQLTRVAGRSSAS
jgi:DNA-binding transcriptional MerR regulator/methylmalonyl-CoA mutase cobalamin-binding subunit